MGGEDEGHPHPAEDGQGHARDHPLQLQRRHQGQGDDGGGLGGAPDVGPPGVVTVGLLLLESHPLALRRRVEYYGFELEREVSLARLQGGAYQRQAGIEDVTRKIQDDRPKSEEILAAYQKAMQSARQFVKDRELVSFPRREELHVVHTPEFRRHEIPFAAYLSPSPKDPDQVGYYYVTPVADAPVSTRMPSASARRASSAATSPT